MKLKDGTIGFQSISPQLTLGLWIIDQVMQRHGQEALITSLNDGTHSSTSLHNSGNAADLRSRFFGNKQAVLQDCKEALGMSVHYDMILESEGQPNEHFHLEYQPKTIR